MQPFRRTANILFPQWQHWIKAAHDLLRVRHKPDNEQHFDNMPETPGECKAMNANERFEQRNACFQTIRPEECQSDGDSGEGDQNADHATDPATPLEVMA